MPTPDSTDPNAMTYWTMGRLATVSGVAVSDETVLKTAHGIVQLMCEITTSATVAAGNHLARLPVGFRPKNDVYLTVPIYLATNTWATRQVVIDSDGWIKCNVNSNGSFKMNGYMFAVVDSIYGGISYA